MINTIQQEIKKLLEQAGVTGDIQLSSPPTADMGDVAFACFQLAKEQGKKPNEVAENIKSNIKNLKSKIIDRVESFGPYVNFFLNTSEIAKEVLVVVAERGNDYGKHDLGSGKSVMIEYPSNNTHKEFHIGHLRNVCIGNTLVQLYRKSGYTVVPVNYLNDFGAHVARCLWGVLKLHGGVVPEGNRQKWLGEVYAEASQAVKADESLKTEVAEIQQQLEAKDASIWPLFLETRAWSIQKFVELFQELGVEHHEVFYESEIKQRGQTIVDELLEKGVAEVGERGAIIINLEQYNLNVALVRKSDGTGLYLTSDIPLAEKKFAEHSVDESIVVTGTEQNFYFQQLYKILELLGVQKKLTHIGYGLINLPSGKMSSRAGNVILYEDLRDEVYERLFGEVSRRHEDWGEEHIRATTKTLAMAVLKFTLQKHEAAKVVTFDINEAVSFEGYSAPYILYVVARINSLQRKYGKLYTTEQIDYTQLSDPKEKVLVLLLAEYESVVIKALEEYNPSTIARYCFDLAQAFNEFYSTCTILNAPSTAQIEARLFLAQSVKSVLQNALHLLTIDTVEEM